MNIRNKKTIVLPLLLLIISSFVSFPGTGCSNPVETTITDFTPKETDIVTYKTFEMKEDDIRLKYLEHPLFSFEYPDFFNLADLNNMPGHPMTYDMSAVIFTYLHDDPNLLDSYLVIGIESPSITGFNNASEKIEDLFSRKTTENGDLSIKEVSVFGIPGYYLESFRTDVVSPSPRKYNMSYRLIGFEHVGLVWTISMSWNYYDSEPPRIKEYFNHVIQTFKIIE